MERNNLTKKHKNINPDIIKDLQELNEILVQCAGVHNRRARVKHLIEMLNDEFVSDFIKQRMLKRFKNDLIGMNSFSDFAVVLKEKNPLLTYPVEMRIKEISNHLWRIINEGN